MTLNSTIKRVTDRIIARSEATSAPYLERMAQAASKGPARAHLSCSGQAHAYSVSDEDKARLAGSTTQVAGGVPAMSDGVTQREAGMEMSLFPATSSPSPPLSRCHTTLSTPQCSSGFATRSCRAL